MTPKLDIPITLELAQSAYPQYDWTLGYRVSDDFLTVTRVPMFGEGSYKGTLEWDYSSYRDGRYDWPHRWVLEIVFHDNLCYLTKEEMSNELGNSVTEYERKKSILASLKDQSPIARLGDVV